MTGLALLAGCVLIPLGIVEWEAGHRIRAAVILAFGAAFAAVAVLK